MNHSNWKELTSDGTVRYLQYSFGAGTANTIAVRKDDGSWVVISPSVGVSAADIEALTKEGPVGALVAPNAYHHLGQQGWRGYCPNAISYADEQSFARLAQKAPGVPFKPLSELKLPSNIQFKKLEGLKNTDLMCVISVKDGRVAYVGDLISNTEAADVPWYFRMIMTAFGGGTGYRVNPIPAMVYVGDKPTWRNAAEQMLTTANFTAVIPAHGRPVVTQVQERTKAIFQ